MFRAELTSWSDPCWFRFGTRGGKPERKANANPSSLNEAAKAIVGLHKCCEAWIKPTRNYRRFDGWSLTPVKHLSEAGHISGHEEERKRDNEVQAPASTTGSGFEPNTVRGTCDQQ